MMATISKEMTFDCAHMLSGHDGLCKNLHGHTYKVQVALTDSLINKKGASSDQMVMDFAHLKQLMHEIIILKFDHAILFSGENFRSDEENQLLIWAKKNEMRHFILPTRTTAENMALSIGKLIHHKFNELGLPLDVIPKITVKLWETPTSYAEVTYNE